jgi:predicted nucleic acid-binding protein
MRPILVDSSVWIDFYRKQETAATTAFKAVVRADREIVTADLVVMEVLQGFRLSRDVRAAEAAFGRLRCYVLGGERRARLGAENYRAVRSAGVTPRSSIDVLIATACVEEDLELLADDRDFRLMGPHLGLALHGLPIN